MHKKIGLFLFFLFLLATWTAGVSEENKWLKNPPSPSDYPDGKGVLKTEWQIEIRPDGTVMERNIRYTTILTPAGREKYSDYRISYNKDTDTIRVVRAVTVKKDLSEMAVEEGAINDVTPPFLAGAQIYSNLLDKVLSYPAVEPGVTLYLDVEKIRSFEGESPYLSDIIYFQSDDPVVEQKVAFRVPADTELTYKFVGAEPALEKTAEGNEVIYTFTGKEAPQIKEEEFMPPVDELAWRLYFSTFKDWRQATQHFADAFYKSRIPDETIIRKAKELTSGCGDRMEKIQKIFLFVGTEIRNVELKFGIAGYAPNPAAEVLKNRYGDWRDKTVLLSSLMKAAGIESHPVLANSRNIAPVMEVPTLKQFDILLLAVDAGHGDRLFLNPFAEDHRYGYFYRGNRSKGLEVLSDSAVFIQVRPFPERPSRAKNRCRITLDDRGNGAGAFTSALDGFFDYHARTILKDLKGEELAMHIESTLNSCHPGAVLESYNVSDLKDLTLPAAVSVQFNIPDFGIKQGKIMSLEIPVFPMRFADFPSRPRLDERHYPFRITTDGTWTYAVEIEIPEGYHALYLPHAFSHTTEVGRFDLSCNMGKDTNTVIYSQSIVFLDREVAPEAYKTFKEKLESLNLWRNRLLLLEKQSR